MDLSRNIVREPEIANPVQYQRRVRLLAATYATIFVFSIAGIVILVTRGKLFVTLAQRSNVETLILAFFLVFFLYLALLSSRGARGALVIFRFAWMRLRHGAEKAEHAKIERLGPPRWSGPTVGLSMIVERESSPADPVRLRIADDNGDVGHIEIQGARASYRNSFRSGSNNLFAFLVHQIIDVLRARGIDLEDFEVLFWKSIDDEKAVHYLALTHFAQKLEKALGTSELWPKLALTDSDCRELENRLSRIASALRSEAFLPDWEYSGEHKLPIVPEPLGLITLSRSETRVDPLTSMGAAAVVVVLAFVLMLFFSFFPPWVPGS